MQLAHITKRYPSVVANSDVSLTVQAGETHAVLGENGAGKSTLMKIIYGAVKPDEGSVMFDGQPVHIRNPQEARALGISMVFQHFSLFDTLTVAENVWLGLDKSLTLHQVTHSITAKAREYGLEVDPARPVHTLSVGEMQRVEIIRALLTNPKLLILDEPTSVLTPQAVEKLFVVLRQLASEGCSILYISHKLHEIRELCTACTVMRGGKVTGDADPRRETNATLSRLMIGAEPPELEHHERQPGEVVLKVQGLTLPREDQFGHDLDDVSFEVRAGEVVGIAGVSGNGQRELLFALSGEDRRAAREMIQVAGQNAGRLGPSQRRQLGLHFVPEERLGRGAVPGLSLAQNLLLTRSDSIKGSGWIDVKALRRQAAGIIQKFNVKAGGPGAAAKSLSGGNLQKFIVGREIDANPKLLIVSQPTWGVDVGASAQIRAEILALRDAGCAVLVLSEELEELFEISDRLHVIAKGRLSPSVERARATVTQIGEWMSGLWVVHPLRETAPGALTPTLSQREREKGSNV
nr:ABC transporter ATP-binding protein [Ramlibacter monticola]